MKNICTFETARALEKAGFPRPPRAAGQYWYDSFGVLYFIAEVIAPGILLAVDMNKAAFVAIGPPLYFAPTAVDILRELPEMRLYFYAGRWYLEDVEDEFVLQQLSDESDTEVCAAAWLARDKKAVEK